MRVRFVASENPRKDTINFIADLHVKFDEFCLFVAVCLCIFVCVLALWISLTSDESETKP